MMLSRTTLKIGLTVISLAAPALVAAAPTTGPPAATARDVQVSQPSVADTKSLRGAVLVHGDVRRPRVFTASSLGRLDQQTVTTTYTSGGTPTTRTFTGPRLIDVAQAVQPRFDPSISNDALAFSVRVGATDGYRAVVAWGEIDPGFAGTEVLLALTEDGRRLERPRLVVPGDARGGRYVSDVLTVRVIDLGR